jgi:hypothetical protein
MMDMDVDVDEARLSLLPRQLRDEGYDVPTYRNLREAALDGIFDARQRRGLWYYQQSHSAEIARALGLRKRGEPADPIQPRRRGSK